MRQCGVVVFVVTNLPEPEQKWQIGYMLDFIAYKITNSIKSRSKVVKTAIKWIKLVEKCLRIHLISSKIHFWSL